MAKKVENNVNEEKNVVSTVSTDNVVETPEKKDTAVEIKNTLPSIKGGTISVKRTVINGFINPDGTKKRKNELTHVENVVEVILRDHTIVSGKIVTVREITIKENDEPVRMVAVDAKVSTNEVDFTVTVPITEMGLNLQEIETSFKSTIERNSRNKKISSTDKTKALRNMYKGFLDRFVGAEIDVMLTKVVDNTIFGSRSIGMMVARRLSLFSNNSSKTIREGAVLAARVIQVAKTKAVLEVGGFTCTVDMKKLTLIPYDSIEKVVSVGDKIDVKIISVTGLENVDRTNLAETSNNVVIKLKAVRCLEEENTLLSCINNYRYNDVVLGEVVSVYNNGCYLIRLSDGVTCNCDRFARNNTMRPTVGDIVTVRITKKEPYNLKVLGTIFNVIKRTDKY